MTDNYPPVNGRKLPAPNPVTRKAHRRDIRRQVTVPLFLGLALIAGISYWLAYAGIGSLERWSQIATIFLALPALVFGLIVLVILSGLVYVLGQLLRLIPPYARLTQDAIYKIKRQVESGAQVSAKPVIQVQSFLAMIDRLLGKTKLK